MDKFYAVSWSTRPTLTWCDFYKEAYLKEYLEKYKDMKVYYNPETHELVEKKDAKIKRLKDEITKEKQRVQTCKTVIDAYASNIKEAEDNIKKLNKELSELES